MKDWIVISPEGITTTPNEKGIENFQVLGFVKAETKVHALKQLQKEYDYLKESGFEEVWIYPLENQNPYITYLEPCIANLKANDETELIYKITSILKEIGFINSKYAGRHGNSLHFDAYLNVLLQIRVDLNGNEISVYVRYITEKHFVHNGNFKV
jgi:hypothetical protein